MPQGDADTVAIVVPVYQGAASLPRLVDDIFDTSAGWADSGLDLAEIVLVHDGAVDDSATVMRRLERSHQVVRSVWLSRNFGQHAATLAGIASTMSRWVVTIDEDGLHDPAWIPALVDSARAEGSTLVYGLPQGDTPHASWRNLTSRGAKRLGRLLLGDEVPKTFSSFRLLDGEVGRALAAYCGHGTFLDVALSWVTDRSGHVYVPYRNEYRGGRSGYRLHSLLSHFRRLVLTAGTRPLRMVSTLGILATVGSLVMAIVVLVGRLTGSVEPAGWASLMVAVSLFSGLVLLALGIVAEYLGVTINMASGRPSYLIVSGPPGDDVP